MFLNNSNIKYVVMGLTSVEDVGRGLQSIGRRETGRKQAWIWGLSWSMEQPSVSLVMLQVQSDMALLSRDRFSSLSAVYMNWSSQVKFAHLETR